MKTTMKTSANSNDRCHLVSTAAASLWLLAGFWISIAISVAVVVRRLVAIIHPSQSATSPTDSLDATFASHAALTLAHIVPAMAFVLLTAFVFLRRAEAGGCPARRGPADRPCPTNRRALRPEAGHDPDGQQYRCVAALPRDHQRDTRLGVHAGREAHEGTHSRAATRGFQPGC